MTAYYNEFDPGAAAWLRELIKSGQIAAGDVDERSIEDVQPDDLRGYTQCHFFAGIGGWSLALRQAGFDDARPVWTGSCPCQPFSTAGKGAGFADERHLWPDFFHLIEQCRPPVVFGEQVASPDGLVWLERVHADLEAAGYAFGAADLCAAGVGSPHIRQRLYWAGVADDQGLGGHGRGHQAAVGWVGAVGPVAETSEPRGLGDAERWGPQSRGVNEDESAGGTFSSSGDHRTGPTNGHWRNADWLGCRDGKWRPVEPGTFPLANGIPARVGRLRGYGNAIVPQVAEAFIRASGVIA